MDHVLLVGGHAAANADAVASPLHLQFGHAALVGEFDNLLDFFYGHVSALVRSPGQRLPNKDLLRGWSQNFTACVGNQDGVLNADAAFALKVNAGFDGNHHALLEHG